MLHHIRVFLFFSSNLILDTSEDVAAPSNTLEDIDTITATPSVDDLGKFAQRETEHIAVILGVVRGVFENEIQANMVTKIIYQEWCRSHGGSR